jgi:hypothetical protein
MHGRGLLKRGEQQLSHFETMDLDVSSLDSFNSTSPCCKRGTPGDQTGYFPSFDLYANKCFIRSLADPRLSTLDAIGIFGEVEAGEDRKQIVEGP